MIGDGVLQLALYFGVLTGLAIPLGKFMARVYRGQPTFLTPLLDPVERLLHRAMGVRAQDEMGWKHYALAALAFNVLGALLLYAMQRVQGALPLNPQELASIAPSASFNTAVSFVTNTDWQSYAGESTLSTSTQMLGLGVQNFLSAATGMAVLIALVRAFMRSQSATIGNFWIDMTRSSLYILLPLSCVLALVLVSEGALQNFAAPRRATLVEPVELVRASSGPALPGSISQQVLPQGPVASQVAIKQLGTNGGGFFNANSAHPFENPTPFSNFAEVVAILLIPAALCFAFGELVNDPRQGRAIYAAMSAMFLAMSFCAIAAESTANPNLTAVGIEADRGNMEGKEVRFGPVGSALWASATTAAANGSVNAMHDSFMPLGGLVPLWLMQLGEVVFGGVGSGLYGMLMFALFAVFIAGLMVGRTPEYLGKKVQAYEMKMASLVVLVPPFVVLVGTALAVGSGEGAAAISNPVPHGFSQVLYAFSSAAGNNGSAFAGLSTHTPFFDAALGIVMWVSRFGVMVPVLAAAGRLAAKKTVMPSEGTLPTHTPIFVVLLVCTVLLVGALTFLPALALGPIAEHLILFAVASPG